MRSYCLFIRFLLGVCLSFPPGIAYTQVTSWPQNLKEALEPGAVAARKAAVKTRLDELATSKLSEEKLAEAHEHLEKLLSTLTGLEEAVQRRSHYLEKLQTLPKRLQELTVEREQLEKRQSARFEKVTETLREEYENRRTELQTRREALNTQIALVDVRLARIPQELEQRALLAKQMEQELHLLPTSTAQETLLLPTTLLNAQLQAQRVEMEALEAERTWLMKWGPLHDALMGIVNLRLRLIHRDLQAIKHQLVEMIRQEREALRARAKDLEQHLLETDNPAEEQRLAVSIETIGIRQVTTGYRQQLNQLDDKIEILEARNARLKQDAKRVVSLVEKYSSGEIVAQRLLTTFKRLRHERERLHNDLMQNLKRHLGWQPARTIPDPINVLKDRKRTLTEALFELEDKLYEFDLKVEGKIASLATITSTLPSRQREAEIALLRAGLSAEKAALRDQQKVLTALVRGTEQQLAFHREQASLIDENYRLVLNKLFWVRDGEVMSVAMLPDILQSIDTTAARLDNFARFNLRQFWPFRSNMLTRWLLAVLLLCVLPWGAYWGRARFQRLTASSLAACTKRHRSPLMLAVVFIALQAVVWPMYLVIVGHCYMRFTNPSSVQADLILAFSQACYVSACILLIGFFSSDLLQPGGWVSRFWEVHPEINRFLRRTVLLGCSAALILLVPRQIVLTAANGTGGEPLARLLLLVFQGVTFLMLLVVGRRGGPLITTVFNYGRERQGFFWHIWPFIHLILLCGVICVVALEMVGYQYASKFIWFNMLESLSILLGIRLILLALVLRLVQKMISSVFSVNGCNPLLDRDAEEEEEPSSMVVRMICQGLLVIAGIGLILELWGISATWLLTSTLGQRLLSHAGAIVMALGVAVFIIQLSNVLVDQLVKPRVTAQGSIREAGQKLRTLAPLVQAAFKIVVGFGAVLFILEQLGVSTGAMLAGIGIAGVAVGIASQSIVKDLINGLFLLFEDSLAVGDLVTLNDTRGFVEKITLRSVTVRDMEGVVHLIPNNMIEVVSNETRDFSCYLLDVQVDGDENVDTVLDIIRQIDEEMRHDAAFSDDLVAPADMVGLQRFEGDVLVMRVRLTTRPHRHLELGREYNRRLKNAFDAQGIQLPSPGYKVALRMPRNGSPNSPLSDLSAQVMLRERQGS